VRVRRGPELDPTAVLGRRAGSWFIDVVLCGLAGAAPALLLADAYSLNREADSLKVEWTHGDLAVFVRDTVVVLTGSELAVVAGCFALAVLLFVVLLPGLRGWSPGRLAADVRVVDRQGEPPGVLRSLLRTLCWIVDILPGIPLVAYVTARRTFRHQRVGDLVAHTYVVDKRARGRPIGAPPEPWTEPVEVVEVEPLGPEPEPEAEPEPEPEPEAEPEPEPEPEAEPEPEPAPQPEPVAEAVAPPPGVPPDQAIWDRRHRRYVLWHSKAGRWLEHVDDEWRPVEGEAAPEG
jgi:uncharacterized RDD family membrane protein YckC